jgi:prepilin-type N-terminal cleavage/methylation domain-containing protein
MNKRKGAFSLIEVLLVMAIIAVVMAMGFSITKTGMEKAYNLYWYTGYSTLNDGTIDAVKKGKFSPTSPNFCDYVMHIAHLINSNVACSNSTPVTSLSAPNGISYEIKHQSPGDEYYVIEMSVPHAKTVEVYKTKFIYSFDSNYKGKLVYPAAINEESTGQNLRNLQERPDLLPFYIKKPGDNKIKEFYGFKDAYCKLYPTYGQGDAEIDCSDTEPSISKGRLRHISPRKAF